MSTAGAGLPAACQGKAQDGQAMTMKSPRRRITDSLRPAPVAHERATFRYYNENCLRRRPLPVDHRSSEGVDRRLRRV